MSVYIYCFEKSRIRFADAGSGGGVRGKTCRGPFGIEKLDHPSDRRSVAARAYWADRAVKVINNPKVYIRNRC